MADYQRIVEDIRAYLHSGEQSYRDELKQLAIGYAEACNVVNERLRRSDELLVRGLRTEAIHLAEAAPVLLDLVTLLDIPERQNWEQVVQKFNLTMPPQLRMTSAEALNKAYAEEQPLEHLLKQHRRLALARATLRERLNVLRQLSQHDAANASWPDQIGVLERARHREITTAVDTMLKNKNLEGLFGLWDELRLPDWKNPPPVALLERVNNEVHKHSLARNVQRLEQVAGELGQAYSERDVTRARQLREQWLRVCDEVSVGQKDPIRERAKPALRWLEDLEQQESRQIAYQTDLDNLEEAMSPDSRTKTAALVELFEILEGHRRAIPPAVKRRYEDRLASLARQGKLREIIILGLTIGAGVVGLIVLIVALSK